MIEMESGVHRDATALQVRAATWCQLSKPLDVLPPALAAALGTGEAAVIQTAQNENLATVAIDERKGRRVAASHGLRVTGSLGLLLVLRRHRLITSIQGALARLKAKGIHLSDDLANEALSLAGDTE